MHADTGGVTVLEAVAAGTKTFHFRAPPNAVDALVDLRIDCVTSRTITHEVTIGGGDRGWRRARGS